MAGFLKGKGVGEEKTDLLLVKKEPGMEWRAVFMLQ